MLHGGCHCGFVRYRADGAPYAESNCHCSICRRTSGAPFVAWFSVSVGALRFVNGTPTTYRSSDHATRSFCPRCGTQLTFASDRTPHEVDITICSLDDPAELPPREHIHASSRVAWVRLCDGLPDLPEGRTP